MSAYLIYRAWVRDPAAYAAYMAKTPELIRRFGGRFLVRGGVCVTLEGSPDTARSIIVEFPNRAAAEAFYRSDAYGEAMELRRDNADVQIVIIEGIAPGEEQNPAPVSPNAS